MEEKCLKYIKLVGFMLVKIIEKKEKRKYRKTILKKDFERRQLNDKWWRESDQNEWLENEKDFERKSKDQNDKEKEKDRKRKERAIKIFIWKEKADFENEACSLFRSVTI